MVVVKRAAPAETAMRGVSAAIRFQDPAGNRLEAFHGAETADTPFAPGRPITGFRTGPLGMGHVVLHVKNVVDLRWFYQDVLGFRVSDYILHPFKAFFFQCISSLDYTFAFQPRVSRDPENHQEGYC